MRAIVERQMKAGESSNAGLLTMSGVSVRELHRLVAAVKKRMPQITTQALVVHSREDDITSRWNADYVERKLGGPVVKILLDDCYHMITVDLQYRRVVALSVDFIRQCFKQQSNTPLPVRQDVSAIGIRQGNPMITALAFSTIEAIDRDAWNDCFPAELEDWDYYRAVEQAGIADFQWRYLVLYEQQVLIAAAVAFTTAYSLDTTVQGLGKRISRTVAPLVSATARHARSTPSAPR